jgi:hypothetical protein
MDMEHVGDVMSEKFGFPVFTVGILLLAGIIWLLEVNGMIPFGIPWIPIIVIFIVILILGAIIFGRDKNRPGFCPFSGICPFNGFCPLGHKKED